MAKILDFTGETTVDLPAKTVLEGAIKQDLDIVLVIGVCKDGQHYYAGSTSSAGEMLLLVEIFKSKVILDI